MVDFRCGSEHRKHFDRHARPTVSLFFFSPICDRIACLPTNGKELFGGHEMPFLHHCFPEFVNENWHGFCSCQRKKPRCWPFVCSDSSEARFLIDTSQKKVRVCVRLIILVLVLGRQTVYGQKTVYLCLSTYIVDTAVGRGSPYTARSFTGRGMLIVRGLPLRVGGRPMRHGQKGACVIACV